MTCVIQRVSSAKLTADGNDCSAIGRGLWLLLGVLDGDDEHDAELLAEKITKLRIFSDENGKMNLSVRDVSGELLVVSNFTLGANYQHGNRPDFFGSMEPRGAKRLYEYFISQCEKTGIPVKTGVFGADMAISATADGPVTIVMDSLLLRKGKQQ